MTLLFSFLFLGLVSAAETPGLTFMENPAVETDRPILLKDIASIHFLDSGDTAKLGEIEIASSYEELKKMSSRQIMRKIKPKLRVFEAHCECKLQVTIPHAMVVRSLRGTFAIEKVQTTIQRELEKNCEACEYEISPLNIIRGSVPENYVRWNVDVRRNEWRGPTMVRVYFDDEAFAPLVLQTLIKVKKPVLRLNQSLGLGQQITAAHVEAIMTDVTYEPARYAQITDLVGMEAKRTLAKGVPLTMDDLVGRNMIRIGQAVSVEVQNKAFMIEMTGVAQKNGKLGETIPVRINKTQKNISAEIISDARVRM